MISNCNKKHTQIGHFQSIFFNSCTKLCNQSEKVILESLFLRWKYQKYNLKIPKKAKFGPKPETLLFTKQFDGADFNYSVKFLKFQSINTRKKTLFSTKFIDFSSFCLKLCVLTNSRELISNNGNSFLKLVYKNTQNKHFCSQM